MNLNQNLKSSIACENKTNLEREYPVVVRDTPACMRLSPLTVQHRSRSRERGAFTLDIQTGIS